MSSYEGYRRCPLCGSGHAWEFYDNRSRQEEFSCGACGHFEGWNFPDIMGRLERRAATGERFDLDGTGEFILARYRQTGHGVAHIQLVDGHTRRHHFRSPLTDRGIARLRRVLEADPRVDAEASWITRWNGEALEVVHGTLPPGGYDYEEAEAEAARDEDMEQDPATDDDRWDADQEPDGAIIEDAVSDIGDGD